MYEVDVNSIDKELEVAEGVDLGLRLPPVKFMLPMMCQFLQEAVAMGSLEGAEKSTSLSTRSETSKKGKNLAVATGVAIRHCKVGFGVMNFDFRPFGHGDDKNEGL